jgi:thioredoxin-like negative regulator of GroEL
VIATRLTTATLTVGLVWIRAKSENAWVVALAALETESVLKPGLVFFHSALSGRCRRVEGFIAQVLQRRRNHETFKYYAVAREQRPDLVEKFGVTQLPTLVVVKDKIVCARLEAPRGCQEIERFLAPWLQ